MTRASATWACQCGAGLERPVPRSELEASAAEPCRQCGTEPPPVQPVGDELATCPVCGFIKLYKQRDFNQRVGLAIVVIAAILAPFTFYLSLVGAALLDALLYWISDEVVICYRYTCQAHLRGVPAADSIEPFDLATYDYFKSEALAEQERAAAESDSTAN